MQINENYEALYEIIKKTAIQLKLNIDEDDKVVVMLVKCPTLAKSNVRKVIPTLDHDFKIFQYCWSSITNKQSLIGCQIFFSEYFSVKYQIFLLPSTRDGSRYNNDRFKDVLDYNRYILLMENLKNVNRMVFERTFKQFNTHKINYILGE